MKTKIHFDRRIKLRRMTANFIGAIVAILFCAIILAGCAYKGAKVVEGTDLAIGLNVPTSDGVLQLQALNYLSGFRLGVDRNAILRCSYTVAESNSYLGVVNTHVSKTLSASVEPCEELTATNTPPSASCSTAEVN